MAEAEFWAVIARADRSPERLRALLNGMTQDEVHGFQDRFLELSVEVQGPDGSEDHAEDMANWVVSQGRDHYEAVLAGRAPLPDDIDPDDHSGLHHVAYYVYHERFGVGLDLM